MGRNVDLTGKLGLEGKPTITVKGKVLAVNDRAANMLQVMEAIGDDPGSMGIGTVLEVSRLVFDAKGQRALESLDLSFQDYAEVVSTAIGLIIGGSAEGEAETRATTS